MKYYVGMDIGAVGITAAVVVQGNPGVTFKGGFSPAGKAGGLELYLSHYRRTRGRPIEVATELLEEIVAAVGARNVASVCLTGSAARLVADKLACDVLNEFKAIALGLAGLGIEARTVFEMGGQSSKYLLLEKNKEKTAGETPAPQYSIVDYATNGDCAAGTGSFIDQQAGRLRFAVEDVGKIALEAKRPAQVAGRCSVFAKSDMIHAQQKGYAPSEVLAGLCNAVARNFRMAVVRSHPVHAPVVFIGGLAANAAVVRGLRESFTLSEQELAVPTHFAHVLSVGAAIAAATGGKEDAETRRRTKDAETRRHGDAEKETDKETAETRRCGDAESENSEMALPSPRLRVPASPCPSSLPSPRPSSAATGWSLSSALKSLHAASDATRNHFPTAEPLSTEKVLLLRDHVEPYQLPFSQEKIDAWLGIDIGSVSTNVVLIDPDGNVIKEIYVRTKGRPIEVVSESLKEVAQELGDRVIIRGVGTTGSGRELIGELVGADTINDEITAHKTGATFIGQKMLNGRVPDTIFEIGGQDSKFISLQDGIVVDFTMNEACAAGTGSFLEERAEELDVAIVNEFAELALSSQAPIRLGERCTVFMERDVNDYLLRGASKADLVAGLAYSVVYNYINRVVRGRSIGECIFFQGGTAYNDAVAAAFAAVLDKEIIVPPYNGVMGAIGAALLARERAPADAQDAQTQSVDDLLAKTQSAKHAPGKEASLGTDLGQHVSERPFRPAGAGGSRFRGYDLSKVKYNLREFTCKGCTNTCIIQEFDVEGEKTYWGDKCSDRYRKRRKSTLKPVIEDLFALRARLIDDIAGLPAVPDNAPSIGIPRAMFGLDFLPFWRTFWAHCGCKVVLSDPTNRNTAALGTAHVVAEPCFPVIVAHGHVAQLAGKVDWLFVPNLISAATQWEGRESYMCPWNQTLPFVLRRVPAFEKHIDRILCPAVRFREGKGAVAKVLYPAAQRLGVTRRQVDRALEAAYQVQQAFRDSLLAAGRQAMEQLHRTGQPGIIIIGRPYNVHDAGVNLSVAGKLRDHYGVNCIPVDCLDTDPVDISDVNDNMYWDYGRRLLAAAKLVGERDNLHIIYITNFKCGPDSYVKHFIRQASGKPFLCLQFDGHSNDAGMMTRCEAYLDSKGILRPWRKTSSAEEATVST